MLLIADLGAAPQSSSALWLMASLLPLSLLLWWLAVRLLWRLNMWHRVEQSTQQSLLELFMFTPAKRLMLYWLLLLLLLHGLALLLLPWSLQLPLLLLSVFLPRRLFGYLWRRRQQLLQQQLPRYLLSLAGAMRSGSSLTLAIQQQQPGLLKPLQQEIGLLLQQVRYGKGWQAALQALAARAPSDCMMMFVHTAMLGQRYGGQQAPVFEQLANTLEQRLAMFQRQQSLTAQARLQGQLLFAMPFLLAAALWWIQPEHIGLLWQHRIGQCLLALCVILMLLGRWLMQRMIEDGRG